MSLELRLQNTEKALLILAGRVQNTEKALLILADRLKVTLPPSVYEDIQSILEEYIFSAVMLGSDVDTCDGFES